MNPSRPTPNPTPTTSSHKRKISFADLSTTFRRAGPIYHPNAPQSQHQHQHQPPHPHHPSQQVPGSSGGGGGQQHPSALTAQLGPQQLAALRQTEASRRRALTPTDRNIPDELADVVVGDGVQRYEKLRGVERKLDALMMRKRLDVSDNLQRKYTRREGVLRVWVSNSAEGQAWQVFQEEQGEEGGGATLDFGDASAATFRVKIEGRLLEEPMIAEGENKGAAAGEKKDGAAGGEDAAAEKETAAQEEKKDARRPRLSHFFKSITVDFDRNAALQPDGYSAIEWRKPLPSAPGYDPNSSDVSFDALEFERKGDENINITISLVRDEKHDRYKLSPALAELLDTEEEDRAGAVQGVWEYCRAMGLQEDEDRRSIVCDEALRRVFQQEKLYFPDVPDHIRPHLHPLPPIQLPYTIRVDQFYISGPPPSSPTIYDLRVPLPNPLIPQLARLSAAATATAAAATPSATTNKPSQIQSLQTLSRLDADLALLVQKVHHTNAKRKFFENLAKDPAGFVRRWAGSQRRDLEVLLAEDRNGGGASGDGGGEGGWEWRRGGSEGVWGSERAREGVGVWVGRVGGRGY